MLQEQSDRDEVHVGDGVFEPGSDERCDGGHDREDLVDDAAPSRREPDRETHERVREDAANEGRPERQRGFLRRDPDSADAERAVVQPPPIAAKIMRTTDIAPTKFPTYTSPQFLTS
jgi:hypothetical protein